MFIIILAFHSNILYYNVHLVTLFSIYSLVIHIISLICSEHISSLDPNCRLLGLTTFCVEGLLKTLKKKITILKTITWCILFLCHVKPCLFQIFFKKFLKKKSLFFIFKCLFRIFRKIILYHFIKKKNLF